MPTARVCFAFAIVAKTKDALAKPDYDLVVIGGGAGGLVVAAGGAALGAKVALVEKHRLGGDCLWTGCVPSKALVKAARVAHEMRTARRWGLPASDAPVDLPAVLAHVRSVVAEVAEHDTPEHFGGLGVEVIFGAGRFGDARTFVVEGRRLTAGAFVIATGSRPALPPIQGLAQVPYLTNESVFECRDAITGLAVLGGGPIGCELAQAFARLGTRVTLVDVAEQILPHEDGDLAAVVRDAMTADGVACLTDTKVAEVARTAGEIVLGLVHGEERTTVRASHVLIATGRQPNVDDLGLDAAGVRVDPEGVRVDAHLRTTNRRVYAIGDVAGALRFTHLAEHHAGIVLRQALFRLAWTRPSTVVPWCTFTDPELARVGLSEREARAQAIEHTVYRFPCAGNDRAHTDRELAGFGKLLVAKNGRILGAAIVGAHAGELIGEFALAMQHGLKANALSATIHPYPTWSQTSRRLADQRLKSALTPGRKALLKRLYGWRGT